MDPDKCLAEIRELIAGFQEEISTDEVEELNEKFEALDTWLKNGGFLPRDWQANRVQENSPQPGDSVNVR